MPKFSPEYLDELKSRLRPSDVIGRHIKLQRRGANWWGLSPFNKEKTPSFTVNDERRSYHCYSSDNHGDIIKFLQETQGLTFVEAVTRLAEEAGMEIPADDPRAMDAAKARKGLTEACAAAAVFYRKMLLRSEGRHALDYVKGRAISDEQIDVFHIGYAPRGRTSLKDYLINKGFSEKALVEAGLVIRPDDGGASYDRFRDRVMFPIFRNQKEVIAFGGRALDPNARAKYLNSPETPIFHKSDVLYNFDGARAALAKGDDPAIVCEGYMDVIALWGAGLKGAVAPLGTALTERQIGLVWRLRDEPVLCLDGDKAGVRAAHRAIDRALPLLVPGKSLSFVFLPDGQDPDDIVRRNGPAGMAELIAAAQPMVDVLWRREEEVKALDTPERRADFRARLRELASRIQDKDVRNAYASEIVARLRQMSSSDAPGPQQQSSAPARGRGGFVAARKFRSDHEKMLALSRPTGDFGKGRLRLAEAREASIALCCARNPGIAQRYEQEILALTFDNPDVDRLITEVFSAILADHDLDSEGMKRHLLSSHVAESFERLLNDEWLNRQNFLRTDAKIEEVEAGWRDALRRQQLATSAEREVSESASEVFSEGDDSWRAAAAARRVLAQSGKDRLSASGDDAGADALLDRLERAKSRFQ